LVILASVVGAMLQIVLLTAGLGLRLRARLQGSLANIQVEDLKDTPSLLKRLEQMSGHNSPSHLILDEQSLNCSLTEFFQRVPAQFNGQLVVCIRHQRAPEEISEWRRKYRVVAVIQNPVDAEELVRRSAIEFGLTIKRAPASRSQKELETLKPLWEEQQGLIEARLEVIAQIASSEKPMVESLDEAWKAAQALTQALDSFNLEQASLLAQEGINLISSAQKGQPLERRRLQRVMGLLREKTGSFDVAKPQSILPPNQLIIVTTNSDLVKSLSLEALIFGWSTAQCSDLEQLTNLMEDPRGCALMLDLESEPCSSSVELTRELLEDPIAKVALVSASSKFTALPPEQILRKPLDPYKSIVAVLKAQSRVSDEISPSVLVVDEDPVVLKVITSMLSQVDFRLNALSSSTNFWTELRENRPDVILLDHELSPITGVELCRAVRRDPEFSAIPILVMSSDPEAKTVQGAFEAGADDFLFKPLTGLELLTRLSNRLERTRQIAAFSRQAGSSVNDQKSLDQLVLKALRDESEVCLILLSCSDEEHASQTLRALKQSLRLDDVIRGYGPLEIIVAMNGVNQATARKRLGQVLSTGQARPTARFASFPTDGRSFEALLDAAKGKDVLAFAS
jgi:DNA-binding response OmpR family regulator